MYTIEELREMITALTARLRFLANNSKSIAGRAEAEKRDITQAEAKMVDKYSTEFEATETELKTVKAELSEAEAQEHDSARRQPQAGQLVARSKIPCPGRRSGDVIQVDRDRKSVV